MNDPIKIPIYIPDAEAKQFLLFQQYYAQFKVMIDSRVFEQRNCSITLNFDNDGTLKDIKRTDTIYSRKRSVENSSQ